MPERTEDPMQQAHAGRLALEKLQEAADLLGTIDPRTNVSIEVVAKALLMEPGWRRVLGAALADRINPDVD